MTVLHDALERLVVDVPYRDARAILRISSAIGSRVDRDDYLATRGPERFARELALTAGNRPARIAGYSREDSAWGAEPLSSLASSV